MREPTNFELSSAQQRRLLTILGPPSSGAVIRHIKRLREHQGKFSEMGLEAWSKVLHDEVAAMADEDLGASVMLGRIESCVNLFHWDMQAAEEEIPSAQLREHLREASKHFQRALRSLRRSGTAGISAAASCMVYEHERDSFYVSMLIENLNGFSKNLNDAAVREYAVLSAENRKRQKAHRARLELAANFWTCYCDAYGVSRAKRTDHRYNKLAAEVFAIADQDYPQDLRRIINAGRRLARESMLAS